MNFSTINWLAVVAAALSSFVIGGLWFSPVLFCNVWMRVAGLTEEQVKRGNKRKIFGVTAILSFIMALNLAMFLNDPKTTMSWGVAAGFLAGVWTFCAIAMIGLFELKSCTYIFINGLYSTLSLTVMGLIIGAWR
ncbi:MAG: DUF1761 domain-containing protein [Mucilaginibacter sp.]